ncbi:carboxymuconolactone decarboxylase family protein [Croceicoccus sp. BE223]|uniref:carboxymuconolactone decarboxylase family protein n=1 Tax=Croceicoccus sp. BE223 TaxID=2817716 RepID=UPI002860549A|nr:carboxymuconolactone decarboxylase family protein [Croceicoccus sp. BE223]MDR7101267.1 alkylhydroperoxidase family enzyme [Croceicoccus sp. BE223]
MRVELAPQPHNALPNIAEQYAPDLVNAANAFAMAPYRFSTLPLRLFEACRIATAVINGCIVCKNWRSQRDLPLLGVNEQQLDKSEIPDEAMYQAVLSGDLSSLSPKERVAVQYSQRMGNDPHGLAEDEAFWAELKSHLTDNEIVELTYSTAAWMGMGRVAHVLGADLACSVGGPLAEAA